MKLNRRVEILHKTIGDHTSGIASYNAFPSETLTTLCTTWAEVKQLASRVNTTEREAIQTNERISVTIRYRNLPESLVVSFNGSSYNVTEVNEGNFDKRYLTLFCDRIEGVN